MASRIEQYGESQIQVALPHGTSVLKDAALVVGASALMAICAHVSVPLAFSPVPITLQTFGLLLIAFVLGSKRAMAAMMLYLLEGASGLPVFSPAGPGGVAQLLGPTGGFLFAYPVAAYVAGSISKRARRLVFALAAAISAEMILFASGIVWFVAVTGTTFIKAVPLTILPFIPGEILKIAAAVTLASFWHRKQ